MVGRLATLRFGEAILREPIAVFYTDVRGDNASRAYDGLIGGGVLRRFRVTVDLRGKRLFIQPGADVGRPFETDMSGMELLADGDDLRTILIDDVSGAAAETGIHGGDVLIGIDGTLAKELGIEKIRTLMRQSGASYDLTVSRDGKLLHFRLTLKRRDLMKNGKAAGTNSYRRRHIGMSIARELHKKGAGRILLLEKGGCGAEALVGGSRMLGPQAETEDTGVFFALCSASRRLISWACS
jgi:hypothetical protein